MVGLYVGCVFLLFLLIAEMDFSFSFNFDEFLVIDIDGHSVFTFLVYGHCKGELPL